MKKQSLFKICDLFTWSNGNTDIKKEDINGKGYLVVSSGVENQGIIGRTDMSARVLPKNTVTIDMFGNVYYRNFEYKEVTHARVFTLIPNNFTLNTQTGLYIVTSLKWLSKVYSYDNMCSYEKIKNVEIKLPVKESSNTEHQYAVSDIDWDYMQEYIRKLELERIRELELYLRVTGLNSYELTDEEKIIMARNGKSGGVKQVHFKIADLFEIVKGKRLTRENQTIGTTPFIGSTELNNGITAYIGQQPIYNENAITVSYNGSVGQAFYQEKPFWASDDINVLYLKGKKLNNLLFGYLGTCLKKSGSAFSYTQKWNMEKMRESHIVLPIRLNTDGSPKIDSDCIYHPEGYIPDFDFMEKYIRAMQKKVIADVVKYKDEIISHTEEIVS